MRSSHRELAARGSPFVFMAFGSRKACAGEWLFILPDGVMQSITWIVKETLEKTSKSGEIRLPHELNG